MRNCVYNVLASLASYCAGRNPEKTLNLAFAPLCFPVQAANKAINQLINQSNGPLLDPKYLFRF